MIVVGRVRIGRVGGVDRIAGLDSLCCLSIGFRIRTYADDPPLPRLAVSGLAICDLLFRRSLKRLFVALRQGIEVPGSGLWWYDLARRDHLAFDKVGTAHVAECTDDNNCDDDDDDYCAQRAHRSTLERLDRAGCFPHRLRCLFDREVVVEAQVDDIALIGCEVLEQITDSEAVDARSLEACDRNSGLWKVDDRFAIGRSLPELIDSATSCDPPDV